MVNHFVTNAFMTLVARAHSQKKVLPKEVAPMNSGYNRAEFARIGLQMLGKMVVRSKCDPS